MSEEKVQEEVKDVKENFSKEVVTEDFYVPGTDITADEFEVLAVSPTEREQEQQESVAKPEKPKDEGFTLEGEPEELQEEIPDETTEKPKAADEPESDFFEQPVSEDEHKSKVVTEIAGMTAVSEDKEESKEVLADDITRASVQFTGVADHTEEKLQMEEQTEASQLEVNETKRSRSESNARRRASSVAFRRTEGSKVLSRRSSGDDSKVLRSELMPGESPSGQGSLKPWGRESYARPRDTGNADFAPRIRGYDIEDDSDFAGFDMGADVTLMFDDVVEEEEEPAIVEEEHMPVLERAPYYERHDRASEEVAIRKIKNFILQKKLAMYFKRKKMDYVTKETEWSFDQQNKYHRKLEAYGELMEYTTNERVRLAADIEATKKQRHDQFHKLTNMFKKMQSREGDIGYGLINTKTGNAIPDKHVERLIRRQSTQMDQVSSMRLTFIRLKQMVQEKLDAIADLDEIAPGFLLADFEHLKIMNQSYSDKIEERDEELNRLRNKCASTIQILAHLREKSSALENDLEDLKDERLDTENTFTDIRGSLNQTKQQREVYRHSINKMRDESGLLTQPTLLRDMEQGLTDVKVLSAQLEHVRKEHGKRAKQIKIIRKKIEENVEMRRMPRRSMSRLRASSSRFEGVDEMKPAIYKGRPSLLMPTIENDAFRSLTSIKPKITYDRRRYDPHVRHHKRSGG